MSPVGVSDIAEPPDAREAGHAHRANLVRRGRCIIPPDPALRCVARVAAPPGSAPPRAPRTLGSSAQGMSASALGRAPGPSSSRMSAFISAGSSPAPGITCRAIREWDESCVGRSAQAIY
jgi:hypothetical protein